MSDNQKPEERAKSILNNSFYFTGNASLSKELSLWICQLVIDQKLKIDDKIYWTLVQEEIYKL